MINLQKKIKQKNDGLPNTGYPTAGYENTKTAYIDFSFRKYNYKKW